MPVLDPVRPTFRALARTIVPETAALDEADWDEVEAIVEDALAQRPPAIQRQLKVFIRLLNALPLFRSGRTFRGLDDDRRHRQDEPEAATLEGPAAVRGPGRGPTHHRALTPERGDPS